MGLGFLLLFLVLFLSGWASYAIGRVVHKKLIQAGNGSAKVLGALTTIGSFIIIMAAIVFLIIYNVPLGR